MRENLGLKESALISLGIQIKNILRKLKYVSNAASRERDLMDFRKFTI